MDQVSETNSSGGIKAPGLFSFLTIIFNEKVENEPGGSNPQLVFFTLIAFNVKIERF